MTINRIKNTFKFCGNCGSNAIIFLGERSIKCQKCEWLYFFNPIATVSTILFFENKMLFVRRAEEPGIDKLDLVGGFIEFKESAITALNREIFEELKVVPTNLKFFSTFPDQYEYSGINYQILNIFYEGIIDKKPNYFNIKEIKEIIFEEPHQINYEELAFSSVKSVLKKYLSS